MYYTAIFQPSTGVISHAEHFVDLNECQKRAKQFEAHARSLGEVDPWTCYIGTEPVEAMLARQAMKVKDGETPEEYAERADKLAAAVKSSSVLTAPEIDDTDACTELPAWATAQAEVEKAAQFVIDAQQAYTAMQGRADRMADEAYSTSAKSDPEDVKEEKRRRAVSAQTEADHAQARLYHAECDYTAKLETFNKLKEADK